MADILHIADPVVTGDQLRRLHQGQTAVCFGNGTVVTPTAWDYVREQRLQVSRGDLPAGTLPRQDERGGVQPGDEGTAQIPADEDLIREVPPPQMVQEGRCDHPDRPYGCQDDEFGSGFVEPASCRDCPVHPLPEEGDSSDCGGCNRNKIAPGRLDGLEGLVQQITDLVLEQLAGE